MTEQTSTDNARQEGRDANGRFAPGNQLGIPFGPDNPPPKSPGAAGVRRPERCQLSSDTTSADTARHVLRGC
jgi:hypothetical protein